MLRRGMVLITVVIVSMIALTFTGALLYLLSSQTSITGAEKRYTNALEVAKGVSSYIMQLATEGELCTIADCTKSNQKLTESPTFRFKELGNYEVEAYLLKKYPPNPSPEGIYSVKVVVKNKNNEKEKSEIYFVYEVIPSP
ncbi:MAG: hypothetical protein DSY35_00585 [Desulfurobacterium sp.]|nr:MAG: hypothetical protein DSY35_00585 [Desulfurobacterium sp.]